MPVLRLHRLLLATAFATTAVAAPLAAQTTTQDQREPVAAAQTLPGAYLAAKAAQLEGALDIASEYFSQALEIDPNSELLQQEAMFAFLAEGRFEDGTDLAEGLADDVDAGKVARIALGLRLLREGDAAGAIARLDLGDASDLDALLVGHLSAWAEAGAGRFEEALRRVDATVGPDWFDVFNLYQRGLLASLQGDVEEARRGLSLVAENPEAVQTSPDAFLAAVEALATLEAREGERDAALRVINLGLELAPTYDPLLFLRRQIEAPLTIDIPLPVASARDGAAEALYVLGQAINRGDGQQVALLYFQFAQAVADTPSPKLLTALAGTAERGSRIDQAIGFYERIPADSAYHRSAELQMGLDLWYADRKDEARIHLEEAVATYPDDLQAHLAYADVLSAEKDYARAAEILERALELAPEDGAANWNIYYQRGIAYERMKEWDKAEPNFRRALELSPDQPQVLNYLGYSWVDMNRNLDEGLDMIRTAVELRPNDGYIIDSLGWAYYRLERFEEAVQELERAVLITPADPTINDHLGDAYFRVGREREARYQWNRALDGTPEPEPDAAQRIRIKLNEGLGPVGSDVANPEAGAPSDERASNQSAEPDTGAN